MSVENYRYRVITDAVHGDIGLSETETALINTATFQRLRHLNQLGLASLVYPTANHTRFAHSLGALSMMGRIAHTLDIPPATLQKLRIAALLHDVGHYPYSHLMERIDSEASRESLLVPRRKSGKNVRVPHDAYPSHEELTRLIITKRKEVKNLLKKHKLDADEIARIVNGATIDEPNLPRLLHSSLDVDRIDYLLRDSISTGVPFGRVDANYILNNLALVEGEIVVLKKAQTAVEHFILARYFMHKAIYQHHTIAGFEGLLRNILFLLRSAGKLYSASQVKDMITHNSHEFLDFHDTYVDRFVDQFASEQERPKKAPAGWDAMPILCRALKQRMPPKLIGEEGYLHEGDVQAPADQKYTKFVHGKTQRLRYLSKAYGIPEFCFIWEEPPPVKFEAFGSRVSLSSATELAAEEKQQLIKIKDNHGKITHLVEDKQSILKPLSEFRCKISRLYVVGANAEQIKRLRNEVKAWFD
jgi:uncharacterized protein